MSYARPGETPASRASGATDPDGSDVYVFFSTSNVLECCGCKLVDGHVTFRTTAGMLAHLEEHGRNGHAIADRCVESLLADRAENDALMARARR